MKKTRGTEKEIKINPNINVFFGSVDKNKPKSVYIKFSSWSNVIDYNDHLDYGRVISDITKKIKAKLYSNIDIDIFYNNMVIVDMDMRESGISSEKSSFMSCEITLYQKGKYKLSDGVLIDEMKKLSEIISNQIFNKNNFFEFYKDKPKANKKLNESLIH